MTSLIRSSTDIDDRIDVREFGARFGVDSTAEIQAAVDAAAAGQEVFFPATEGRGNWITSQIDLNGRSCSLRGAGDRTVIEQAPGSGVSLVSFTGMVGTGSGIGKRRHGDFRLIGNGGTDVNEHALDLSGISGLNLTNISTQGFGGSGLYAAGDCHFHVMENMVFARPTTSDTDDTPYIHTIGSFSANQMYNIGLRSVDTTPDPLHCVVFEDDATFAPYSINLYGWWIEFLHLKEGGSFIRGRSLNASNIEIPMLHDCSTDADNTVDACTVRLEPGGVANQGGNYLWGQIPGDGGGLKSIPFGVVLAQSRNRVQGIAGFSTGAVRLDAGVQYSHVAVGGRRSGVAQDAVIDNSGNNDNTILDDYGVWKVSSTVTSVPWVATAAGSFTGDGATTVFNIAHGLSVAVGAPQVQLRNTATNEVNPPGGPTLSWVDADTVTATFGAAPAIGVVYEWRAV